ncbi:hypothetical protein CEUSTIGMA_g621.t1 [Chlamydomonas eustigma]|uniref:tRNA pseudouridine synthase n=1 Tax=Chlamydomonas eustigma TaxID=1157962 RepID=A0A250WQS0_9CHLO|nr:hypothetical protein CEUSTIGMA_g621.t1 [Chlamydomonas eustigma]|eukprot:GAX73168.1 hypothetical protein CEUSTIGMA_g621.t1 [Chlamydomonas eustigma]
MQARREEIPMASYSDVLLRLKELVSEAESQLRQSPCALADDLIKISEEIRSLSGDSHESPVDIHLVPSTSGHSTDVALQGSMKLERRRGSNKPHRELDFGKYKKRHVVLEIMYIGVRFQGFAKQDSTDNTIEAELFKALLKTRLIPSDEDIASKIQYSRCGRTDRGVSALGQVVALLLRSNGRTGKPQVSECEEMEYDRILNSALPPEIRVLGWTTAPSDFNARFSARYRQYKYFIVSHDTGDSKSTFEIDRMREAARHFIGEHDFRNFCKPDVLAVRSFQRSIMSFDIEKTDIDDPTCGAHVFALNIRGTAFLWHQVRCMAAVLLLVGRGLEEPCIVSQMLDLATTPSKPQYPMAAEEPLLLYACGFQGLTFRRSGRALETSLSTLQGVLDHHLVAAARTSVIMERIRKDCPKISSFPKTAEERHIKLAKRHREPSVEERMKKWVG